MTKTEDEIHARMMAVLDAEEREIDSAIVLLYGALPAWTPRPSIERARRIIQSFLNDKLTHDQINRFVAEAESDSLTYPGAVRDAAAFAQNVYELAHLRYALSIGKQKGLAVLAGEQAAHGQKFKDGRKFGTCGPIRKAIAKLLAKNPAMKNPELWAAIKAKPPRGWKVNEPKYSNTFAPTIEGPNLETDHMTRRRFDNVCGIERKIIKGEITG